MRKIPSNPLFWSLAVLLFPLLMEVTFSDFVREGEYNSRIGWSFIAALFITLANQRWVTALVLLPFMIGGLADIGYAYTFGGVFTTATIEAVVHTDSSEASEFFRAYTSPQLILLYLLHWLIYALAIAFSRPVSSKGWQRTIHYMGILFVVVVIYRTTVMGKFHDTIPGVLGTMPSYYNGAISLEQEVELRRDMLENTQLQALLQSPAPQTHILIIGESLTRNHMGLYGYHRNTTPQLSALGDELVVYSDAISSHAQTQASLRVALTAASAEQGDEYREALSIIDLANLAGYKTWWISNQQPQRATIASISHQADVAHYISNDFKGVEVRRFDEYLLPALNNALADPAQQKVILIHMMGSHARYANRYPEAFHQFRNNDVIAYQPEPADSEIEAINGYDNSVLYTDHVVAEMIQTLKNSPEANKSLLFFSDHGEEVYRSARIKGHSPDNITANMVEIPLIFWSNNPEEQSAMNQNSGRGFMLDDLFHLAGDLLQINSEAVDSNKSPLSDSYADNNNRRIYRLNYDQEIKGKKTLASQQ